MSQKSTITSHPNYPQVPSAKLPDGTVVAVGDFIRVAGTPGKRAYLAKVTRLDLEHEDGPLRDVTVAVWSKLNGATHAQHGMTRTLFPSAVTLA